MYCVRTVYIATVNCIGYSLQTIPGKFFTMIVTLSCTFNSLNLENHNNFTSLAQSKFSYECAKDLAKILKLKFYNS